MRLLANIPNPFNPRTDLRFELAVPADVYLTIIDAAGRRVRTAHLRGVPAGVHSWTWDGTDDGGRAVGSGVYLVQVAAAA